MKKIIIILCALFFLFMSACYGKKESIGIGATQVNFSFDWETEKSDDAKPAGRFYEYEQSKAKNGEVKSFRDFVNSQLPSASVLTFQKNVQDYAFTTKEVLYENTKDGLFYKELPKVGRFRVALFATPTMNDNDGGAVAFQLQTHDENNRVIDSKIVVNAFRDECSMNRSVKFLQSDHFVIKEHLWCIDFDSIDYDDSSKEAVAKYNPDKTVVVEFKINETSGKLLQVK